MSLEGKRILFFAPTFFDLHTQIKDELERKGALVDYIPDELSPFNPICKEGKFIFLKKIISQVFKLDERRIDRLIKINENQKYDFFLCVNGFSFHEKVISYYSSINPAMKKILYLWDSCDFFDFSSHFNYFDRIYTFDVKDAREKKLIYLPTFWVSNPVEVQEKNPIDLFFVGSMHSDRYSVLVRCLNQLPPDIRCYIRLVANKEPILLLYLKYIVSKIYSKDKYTRLNYDILMGRKKDSFITFTKVSRRDFDTYMFNSRCVLDIALPMQTGVSNRVINALAMGKKIITTNECIKETSLYDPEKVFIIDRENPFIPVDFIKKVIKCEESETVRNLRIDKWVETLLELT